MSSPYGERAARFERLAAELGGRSRLVSNLRGLAFGTAVVALAMSTLGAQAAAGPVAAVAAVAFVGLVAWHGRVIAREDDALRMARVNVDAQARVSGTWQNLPDDGAELNGDVLQTLARLIPMTGDPRLLDWATRIGDAYIEEILPANNYLPGYRYETHFGGAVYVFLRGLDRDSPQQGIYRDRPSAHFIERAERLLLG